MYFLNQSLTTETQINVDKKFQGKKAAGHLRNCQGYVFAVKKV